jgi:hypothetical protein
VHASSIAADMSKSRPSAIANGDVSSDAATEWHASSQDELFVARLGPVLDWWLLGEFVRVASCGTTFRYMRSYGTVTSMVPRYGHLRSNGFDWLEVFLQKNRKKGTLITSWYTLCGSA